MCTGQYCVVFMCYAKAAQAVQSICPWEPRKSFLGIIALQVLPLRSKTQLNWNQKDESRCLNNNSLNDFIIITMIQWFTHLNADIVILQYSIFCFDELDFVAFVRPKDEVLMTQINSVVEVGVLLNLMVNENEKSKCTVILRNVTRAFI